MLVQDDQSRILWRLARVVELLPSRDGEVRSVQVLLGSAKLGEPHVLTRPVGHLYPLEIIAAETSESAGNVSCPAEGEHGSQIEGFVGEAMGGEASGNEEASNSDGASSCNGGFLFSRSSSKSDEAFNEALEKAFGEERRSRRQAAREADFRRLLNQ